MSTVEVGDLPAVRATSADDVAAELAGAPRAVFLDDDPTGTQTVRDLPVLTRWSGDDVAWALAQGGPGFFVLTNTRSLPPAAAAARVREVVENCLRAAGGTRLAFASRGDSTLRGHHPLETDVITEVLAEHGTRVGTVVLAPSYVDAGRITLRGQHLLRTEDGWVPVAESEFAADATFGYRSSRLAEWVAEKSSGRVPAESVDELAVEELRTLPLPQLQERFAAGTPVVALDTVVDDDLRAAVLALLRAERAGTTCVYRCGPSFVRARTGQRAEPPVDGATLRGLLGGRPGLVVVGSHVGRTGRQLARLAQRRDVRVVELDVPALLAAADPEEVVSRAAAEVVTGLAEGTVLLRTSRALVTGADAAESLAVAGRVSAALTRCVARVVARVRPGYVLAKGGITSSDVAVHALGVVRARVLGSVLPGTVSLWEAVDGPSAGLPYVVFAGNVGDDDALADVLDRLEGPR